MPCQRMATETRLPNPAKMRKSVESCTSAWPFSNLANDIRHFHLTDYQKSIILYSILPIGIISPALK